MKNVRKIYWWLSTGTSFNPDYQNVLNRATTLGYTLPSASQQVKQNQLVLDLKDAGLWDLIDVFYVFATDGDSDYATLNWKTPASFKITRVNTPTFTQNQGFNGNGTNSYLNTNWVPSTNSVNLVLDSASIFTHIFNHVTETRWDMGTAPSFIGSSPLLVFRGDEGFGSAVYSINQAPQGVVSNGGNCAGFWQLQRRGSGDIRAFKNAVQVDNETDASTAIPSGNFFLLALNNGGTPSNFTTRKLSMFGAGASLSGSESALYTAWNTYLTSL